MMVEYEMVDGELLILTPEKKAQYAAELEGLRDKPTEAERLAALEEELKAARILLGLEE